MTLGVHAESPPLRQDADGAVRVGASRVLLELVIRAFQDGATPEAIVQRYATLDLGDVYGAIGYYLRHLCEVDAYLAQREREADQMQQRASDQRAEMNGIRTRLLARRQQQG